MPICKFCEQPFDWARNATDKWVTLVPVGYEEGLIRDYQDDEGQLRSSHNQVCNRNYTPTVRVTKLVSPIIPPDVDRDK